MYYNDLITIKYEPIQIVHSKRKSDSFNLRSCTIDELNKAIDKRVKSLKEKGMTIFTLEFSGSEDDDGTFTSWCHLVVSPCGVTLWCHLVVSPCGVR